MLRFGNGKHRSFRAAWMAATVFLAVGFKHAEAVVKSPPSQKPAARVMADRKKPIF